MNFFNDMTDFRLKEAGRKQTRTWKDRNTPGNVKL